MPARPPAPTPPVAARALDHFSPSRVARLIRDPYADYARHVLRLEALRRVGEEIDARERGTAVHAAIEAHETGGGDLGELIVARLLEAGASPEIVELERSLWLRAVSVYRDWANARAANISAVALEQKGRTRIGTAAGEVVLEAKADRIERLTDGTLAVIDFKTGEPPTGRQVASGIEPQLALEALIAGQAPFGAVGPAPTSELIYFRMSTSAAAMRESNGRPLTLTRKDKTPLSAAEVVAATLAGFIRTVEAYSDPSQPFLSRPRVLRANEPGDLDRLARRAEWTAEDGEE
jgi:ATP-dependent helicase/nuclease subunit B